MNEQLNFMNPIDDLFSVPIINFESSLSRISEPSLLKYITISKQFSEDYLFNHPEDILSVDEIAAINLYTREWESPIYKLLNVDLRKQDRTVLKKWFPYLRLLLSGLLKLPELTEILWRGFSSDKDQESIYKQGRKIYWWGFSSCSLTANTVKTFLTSNGSPYRNLFSIKCISGINIKNYSAIPDEDEILLLPGSYFEVKSILDLENNLKMYQLEQIKSQLSLHPQSSVSPPYCIIIIDPFIAVYQGDLEKLKIWAQQPNSSLSITNPQYNNSTLLYTAATKGHSHIVLWLLENGAQIHQTQATGSTPLHGAAYNGHIDVCKLLLQFGASTTIKNLFGDTPIQDSKTQQIKDLLLSWK